MNPASQTAFKRFKAKKKIKVNAMIRQLLLFKKGAGIT